MIDTLNDLLADPQRLVGFSAFLATFVASVMADEQQERLKQGTFGAVAGTAVGALAAVISGQQMLVLVGIFGSAAGAIVGWVVYLALSMLASFSWVRRAIEYHVAGLKGVKDSLDLEEKSQLLRALSVWGQNFRGMVLRETNVIVANSTSDDYNKWVKIAIRGWVTSLVDAFNLVLDALAEKNQYRARLTIIVFGENGQTTAGRHWISYSGSQRSHKNKDFPEDSVAYEVLAGEREAPAFVSADEVSEEGQDRDGDAASALNSKKKTREKPKGPYSFFVFRLTDSVVLSVDWPDKLKKDDDYVNAMKDLLHLDVAPAIGELLHHWRGSISDEVDLSRLRTLRKTG